MSKKQLQPNRRRFLKTALSATGAAVVAPTIIPSSALGLCGTVAPSDRIVIGGIGIGNRGTYDLGCFLEQPDVQFVAVCDVKETRRAAVKKIADTKYGTQDCATYRDFRELLDRDDIDAVLIATGPNWHATAAMTAAKAGKDMYCEKPVTKNIDQSLILAETMRRQGNIDAAYIAYPDGRFCFVARSDEAAIAKLPDNAVEVLDAATSVLEALEDFSAASQQGALTAVLVEQMGIKPRFAFGPLRVAVTGRLVSPPLFESMEILGQDHALARLRRLRAVITE